MKKTYFAPVMECEAFETKDVITVSFYGVMITYNNDYTATGDGVPTADRSEFDFN